jgi:hypothetical protein
MGGIEYSGLNTPAGKTDAFTYLLGIRLKFPIEDRGHARRKERA